MSTGKFVSYLRVSTVRQGQSGLGLEAQRSAVITHVNGHGQLVREYLEVESGKRHENRPQLAAALAYAKVTGAVLIVAKLDRLARNVAFLANLMDAGVEFVCCDMPLANKLTLHVMSAVAEHEREAISTRIREAMQAAKARGVRFGNPNGARALRGLGNAAAVDATVKAADRHRDQVMPVVAAIREEGHVTLLGIAEELNQRGILTARGGRWHARTVKNLVERA
jgi:DNA invertase Pin-like site-specific DNA recombinase